MDGYEWDELEKYSDQQSEGFGRPDAPDELFEPVSADEKRKMQRITEKA